MSTGLEFDEDYLLEQSAVNRDRTFSVKEVNEAISDAISSSFPNDIWVKGEVQKIRFHSSGHIYFDLVDSSSKGSSPSVIPCTLLKWASGKIKADLHEILADDREVRLKAKPDFYAPYGKMSLQVSDVDTQFSLGQIAIARRELLLKLHKEGVLKANSELELNELPINLILITALGSAAYGDVIDQLEQSTIGFNIKVINALMQGGEAPESVAQALAKANMLDGDVVLLCRGGGSKADLSTFDTEIVARAIIASKHVVITGLGHQIDVSVADETAYVHMKTPTACAQFLIERVRSAIDEMLELKTAIDNKSMDRIVTSETRIANISQKLGEINYILEKHKDNVDAIALSIKEKVINLFDRNTQNLISLKKLIHAHDPMRVVERGFSLTFGEDGKIISTVKNIKTDTKITTKLADGELISIVKEKKETK